MHQLRSRHIGRSPRNSQGRGRTGVDSTDGTPVSFRHDRLPQPIFLKPRKVAGTSVDPDEFADLALEAGATAILVSTHNGMALTYAKHLQREVAERRLDIPIAMGGTLNQDIEGEPTPVDVKDDLTALGIHVCTDVSDLLAVLEAAN